MNYDALFLTAFAHSREEERYYHQLDGFARKLILTSCTDHEPDSVYLPDDGRDYYDQHHLAVRAGHNLLDICSLFLGDVQYRRKQESL